MKHREDAMYAPEAEKLREQLRSCRERALIERLRPRYWFARMVVSLEVLVLLVGVSWFEDSSLTAQAIAATGPHGWLLIAGTALCCLVALADVAINDLLPPHFTFPLAMTWRHLGLMGTALQLTAISVLLIVAKGFTVLVLAYWLNAVLAGALTFFDAFARYPRSQAWRST